MGVGPPKPARFGGGGGGGVGGAGMSGEGMRLEVPVWLDFMGSGALDTGVVWVRRVVRVCVCAAAVTAVI